MLSQPRSPMPSSADQAAGFAGGWTISRDGVLLGTAGSSRVAFTPPDDGTYVVALALTDKDGGTGYDTRTIVVTNAPPAVGKPSDQASPEGSASPFDLGTFADPGIYDGPWSVDVNWGDGSPHTTFSASSQGAIEAQAHAYDDNGSYTAKVQVTDKDHGIGTSSFLVTVANVAPRTTILGAPTTGPEGAAIHLGSTLTDPSTVDTTAGFSPRPGASRRTACRTRPGPGPASPSRPTTTAPTS